MKELQARLRALGVSFSVDVAGSKLSSYRSGGRIALLLLPTHKAALLAALRELIAIGIPYELLGGGTNTLVPDTGYAGAVLCTRKLKGISHQGTRMTAAAGETLPALSAYAAAHNLGGLEEFAGIPATVGGALCMNAGAFGRETASLLTEAHVLNTRELRFERLLRAEIPYGYRTSGDAFQNRTICGATFLLSEGHNAARAQECRELRLQKQPREPSLGSVFRNPAAFSAGYLIESVGLKGFCIGGAAFSPRHANFIVNLGKGSTQDYLSLAELAQSMVYRPYKITLQPEFRILH